MTQEQIKEANKLYDQGHSLLSLQGIFGINYQKISKHIKNKRDKTEVLKNRDTHRKAYKQEEIMTEVFVCSCGEWKRKELAFDNKCICGKKMKLQKRKLKKLQTNREAAILIYSIPPCYSFGNVQKY